VVCPAPQYFLYIISQPAGFSKKKKKVVGYDLYCSPNIVLVIKSRRMTWAWHVARMGEERGGCIGSCWGNRSEGDHWGDLGVDGGY